MIESELELFTNVGKHNFSASGVRVGVSFVGTTSVAANNWYLPDTYDPSSPSTFVVYWGTNNLYRWAMSQKLRMTGKGG
jgi:hypothetical protein